MAQASRPPHGPALSPHEPDGGDLYGDLPPQRWGSPETPSGPGSTEARAAAFRSTLGELLASLECRSLLDAPCGLFGWIEPALGPDIEYTGVDIVRDLIALNRRRAKGPRRRFLRADLARGRLPRADVVLCRDCLVHFTDAEVWAAIRNFRRSGSTPC